MEVRLVRQVPTVLEREYHEQLIREWTWYVLPWWRKLWWVLTGRAP